MRILWGIGVCEPYKQSSSHQMPPLTTAALSTEVLQDCLLTLDQLTTSITFLGLNAAISPEQSPRLRTLLDNLLVLIQECENDLGTYAPISLDL